MTRRLVAVHAHPDDESLTMAATLASAVAQGAAVTLITATLGEQGEVIGDELQGLTADHADQLGGYRYTELRAACAALGVTDHRSLGGIGAFRDSGMAGAPSAAHPRAFVRAAVGGPDHRRAVDALVAVLDEVRPDVVATYDDDGGYGHPDHITAHQVTVAAVARAARTVPRVLAVVRPRRSAEAEVSALATATVPPTLRRAPAGELGFLVDDDLVDVAVPTGPWADARLGALRAHATQVSVFDGGFALSNAIARPLPAHECYRVLAGVPVPRLRDAGPAEDLFAGLA